MASFRKLFDVAIRITNSSFMKRNCSLFWLFGCVHPRHRRGREQDPAAEKITLTCIIPSHLTEVKLLITDLTGRVISSNQIQGNPRELEVDISYLNNGSYMVNLEHNGNILASRKLMVVK